MSTGIGNIFKLSRLFSTVTELPVICPDYTDTVVEVSTDPDSAFYAYTAPEVDPDEVMQLSSQTYYYHNSLTVETTVPGEPNLGVGTHTVTTEISDGVLTKTCTYTIIVTGNFSILA